MNNIPCPACSNTLFNEDVEITGGRNHDGEDYFNAEITCSHCENTLTAYGYGELYPQDGLFTIAYQNKLTHD